MMILLDMTLISPYMMMQDIIYRGTTLPSLSSGKFAFHAGHIPHDGGGGLREIQVHQVA